MFRRRPDQWIGLQLVCDALFGRVRARHDVIDVRDPHIDLTTCPTCGTDLSANVDAKVS